ncbi:TetR/AcrR family transcriptional regulator [Pedococcus aerophilus]|uniref:TetR/AcrR family transcriptional regulator n=1 Tax=Pedococcus aerophilus TaxID=436356 RepID=A0ABP6GZ77_9MICO
MPKVVDHEQRRDEIADALWRVVLRDGVAAASVRTVSAEAGWSTGAIRHYFSSQDELMAFAMTTLGERAKARVQQRLDALDREQADLEALVEVLGEVLPLDAQRKAESEVWLALLASARTHEHLRALADDAHRSLRGLCDGVVRHLAHDAAADLDVVGETDRLHGLLDGLAVHGTMYPRQLPRTRLRAAVRAHLTDLAVRAGTV